MEDFKDLLDQYMDIDVINEKVNGDIKEQMEKTNYNKRSENNFVKTITIREFVNKYLGIEHECNNLKHQGLKSFNSPYIIGVSNDFASKNPEYVLKNDILVVIDSYKNPGSYINPNLLRQIETMEEYKYALSLLEKITLNDFSNLKELFVDYRDLLLKIEMSQKSYNENCKLLKTLKKRKVLFEIRNNIKKDLKKYSK